MAVLLNLAKKENIVSWLIETPIRFYGLGFTVCFLLIGFLDLFFLFDIDSGQYDFGDAWDNIVVESHGLLFDLVVLGVLLAVYDNIKEREFQRKIRQKKIDDGCDKINDLKRIKPDGYEIEVKNVIESLNEVNYTEIGLSHLVLNKIDFSDINLRGGSLLKIDFTNSFFIKTNFERTVINTVDFSGEDTRLVNANFSKSKIYMTKFNKSLLIRADFTEAFVKDCDLREANLKGAILEGTTLQNTPLDNAEVDKDFLEWCSIWNIKGDSSPCLLYEVSTKPRHATNNEGFRYFLNRKPQIS